MSICDHHDATSRRPRHPSRSVAPPGLAWALRLFQGRAPTGRLVPLAKLFRPCRGYPSSYSRKASSNSLDAGTPAGVRLHLLSLTGGVAALSPRLMAATPSGVELITSYSTLTSAGVLRKALMVVSTPFSMPLRRISSMSVTPMRCPNRYASQNPDCTESMTVLVAGAPSTVR